MIEKLEIQEFLTYLKDAADLEELRCKQNKIQMEYAEFTTEPMKPPVYKNVATLGLITLPVTWIIFDVFAFYMGSPVVGGIGVGLTVALILFAIVLKKREKKLNEQTQERYQVSVQKHHIYVELQKISEQTVRLLEILYAKEYLYPRFRNLTAERNIYRLLSEGLCTSLIGSDSVFHYYDRERSKSKVRDWEKEVLIDGKDPEKTQAFLEEAQKKILEIEQRYDLS